jgi:hypothetical protein
MTPASTRGNLRFAALPWPWLHVGGGMLVPSRFALRLARGLLDSSAVSGAYWVAPRYSDNRYYSGY